MNEDNVCADLDILKHEDISVRNLFGMQLILQNRLKQEIVNLPVEQASKLIYWRQCIHAECDELVAWKIDGEDTLKEARMEVVDILHFVFNMGISIGLAPSEAQYAYEYESCGLDLTANKPEHTLKVNISNLSGTITEFIDLFPWKTWKNYRPLPMDKTLLLHKYGKVLNATYALGLLLSMDSAMMGDFFIAKNKENHARQDRGY